MLYQFLLPVSTLTRLNKDGQNTFRRASLHPAKGNPDAGWIALTFAPVVVACIPNAITAAGCVGQLVILNDLTAT